MLLMFMLSVISQEEDSGPVMIEGDILPREFVGILTHEIIHVFLESNDIIPEISPVKIYEEMFSGENDAKIINHIIINAIQKYILLGW